MLNGDIWLRQHKSTIYQILRAKVRCFPDITLTLDVKRMSRYRVCRLVNIHTNMLGGYESQSCLKRKKKDSRVQEIKHNKL